MPIITQTVDVEIDVSDLDEDEIVDACKELGYAVTKVAEGIEPHFMEQDINNLAEQYRNNHPQLMETLRTFIQDYTGRLLP